MTIAYQTPGAFAYDDATSPASIPFPASIAAGDKLLLFVGQKPSSANSGSVTTPSGWTLVGSLTGAGGYSTTLGADTGNTNLYVYEKDADGTESGNLSLAHATTNVLWARMLRFTRTAGGWLSTGFTSGSDTSAGSVSITGGSDPGFDAGDLVVWGMCIPTDVTTPSQFSAHNITATGATFGTKTEIGEADSTTGNDIGGYLAYAPVTAGPSSAAPVFTATAGGTTTNVRGPGVFVRLRENTNIIPIDRKTFTQTPQTVIVLEPPDIVSIDLKSFVLSCLDADPRQVISVPVTTPLAFAFSGLVLDVDGPTTYTTAARQPTSASSSGGSVSWTNLTNITADSDPATHVSISGASTTKTDNDWLITTGYGFDIPAAAKVVGIRHYQTDFSYVRMYSAVASARFGADIYLTTDGSTTVGTNQGSEAFSNSGSSGSSSYPQEYGSGAWGTTLTGADVNASTFGVMIRERASGSPNSYTFGVCELVITYQVYAVDVPTLAFTQDMSPGGSSTLVDTGWLSGSVGENAGGTVSFSNPENALTTNATYATAVISGGAQFAILDINTISGAGLSALDADTTLVGVEVEVVAKSSVAGRGLLVQVYANSDTPLSAIYDRQLTTSDATYTFGGPSDLWGETSLVASQFASGSTTEMTCIVGGASSGVPNGGNATYSIDSARLKLYYQDNTWGGEIIEGPAADIIPVDTKAFTQSTLSVKVNERIPVALKTFSQSTLSVKINETIPVATKAFTFGRGTKTNTGWLTAPTAGNSGTGNAWTNPSNALAQDDTFASATITSGQRTRALYTLGYTFPTGIIEKLTYRIDGYASSTQNVDVTFYAYNALQYEERAVQTMNFAASDTDTYQTFEFTPTKNFLAETADFDTGPFFNNTASSLTINIDHIQLMLDVLEGGITVTNYSGLITVDTKAFTQTRLDAKVNERLVIDTKAFTQTRFDVKVTERIPVAVRAYTQSAPFIKVTERIVVSTKAFTQSALSVKVTERIPVALKTFTQTTLSVAVNAKSQIPIDVRAFTMTSPDLDVEGDEIIFVSTLGFTQSFLPVDVLEIESSREKSDAVPGWYLRMVDKEEPPEELETVEKVVIPKPAPTIVVDASEEAVEALRDSLLPAPVDLGPLRAELARLEQERYAEALRQMRLRAEEEEQAVLLTLLASTRRRNRFGIRI